MSSSRRSAPYEPADWAAIASAARRAARAAARHGDATLIEHTENDDFWGDGGDGRGRNELGRILMAVRQRLRDEQGD